MKFKKNADQRIKEIEKIKANIKKQDCETCKQFLQRKEIPKAFTMIENAGVKIFLCENCFNLMESVRRGSVILQFVENKINRIKIPVLNKNKIDLKK